ncbi:MAG: DUF1569 domain-containing protein [Acidimicrobiia bacterium]|nr:DUF1569 domain-containing protein [Acidimicrobiia bacterium]
MTTLARAIQRSWASTRPTRVEGDPRRMRPYRSLSDPANVNEILERLARLMPNTSRQWGTLTPAEMLSHLSDSLLAVLGERSASSAESWWSRTVLKYIALHTSIPWPQGIQTRPEVDPKRAGTKPVEFERDREQLVALVRRFVSPDTRYGRHPGFGAMTREDGCSGDMATSIITSASSVCDEPSNL